MSVQNAGNTSPDHRLKIKHTSHSAGQTVVVLVLGQSLLGVFRLGIHGALIRGEECVE